MKKMTVVSLITLVLCFLAGYLAYQTAIVVKNLIVGRQAECRTADENGCQDRESVRKPFERP
jgi:hypothetical protein